MPGVDVLPKIVWPVVAGLTTMLFDVTPTRFGQVKLRVIVSAVLSARFVKVAIPPETVAVKVP